MTDGWLASMAWVGGWMDDYEGYHLGVAHNEWWLLLGQTDDDYDGLVVQENVRSSPQSPLLSAGAALNQPLFAGGGVAGARPVR